MSTTAALILGFGLGVVFGAPVVAPIALYLFERNLSRQGLGVWLKERRR